MWTYVIANYTMYPLAGNAFKSWRKIYQPADAKITIITTTTTTTTTKQAR